MAPLITVKNLCMDFDGKRILNTISFELSEGEILGIIGRSGAGKTVLMQLDERGGDTTDERKDHLPCCGV